MRRWGLTGAALALSLLFLVPRVKPAATAGSAAPTVNDGHGDYVFVPAGAFKMGDNFGDGLPRERPVHTVELDAFYIGKYEITNGEWKKFRDDPGYMALDNVSVTEQTSSSSTPEPSSLILLGSGVLGLGGFVRRKLIR